MIDLPDGEKSLRI